MQAFKNNTAYHLIMFMLNMPEVIQQLRNELHSKHVILGFPGAGGTYKNNIIDYIQIKQQEIMIGEISGESSVNIKK